MLAAKGSCVLLSDFWAVPCEKSKQQKKQLQKKNGLDRRRKRQRRSSVIISLPAVSLEGSQLVPARSLNGLARFGATPAVCRRQKRSRGGKQK